MRIFRNRFGWCCCSITILAKYNNNKYIVYVKMYVNRTCTKCSVFSLLGKCIHKLLHIYLFFQAAFGSTKYVWKVLLQYNIEMHIGLGMVQYHILARLLAFIDEGKFHGTLFNIFTLNDGKQAILSGIGVKKKDIFMYPLVVVVHALLEIRGIRCTMMFSQIEISS